MNLVQENIIKFIDSVISENYSTAHKYLGTIIEEKLKGKIKKGFEQPAFGGSKEEKKKAKKSAFGGKFPKAKDKKKVVKEEFGSSRIIDLTELLPDGSSALAALFDFEHYHGGQHSHMYGVRSSGKISIDDIPALKSEVLKAIKIASESDEIEHQENFKSLYKELTKLEKRFENVLGSEEQFGGSSDDIDSI
jgi:hypothetical protein